MLCLAPSATSHNSSVIGLFFSSRPSHVSRLVVAIVVYAFQRKHGIGTISDIGDELRKTCKSKLNSSTSIVFEVLGLRIDTSSSGISVSIPLWASVFPSSQSMLVAESGYLLCVNTTTTRSLSEPQMPSLNYGLPSTITQTKPAPTPRSGMVRSLCNKSSESLSNNIYFFMGHESVVPYGP